VIDRIRKFAALPPPSKRLLLWSVATLAEVRVRLWVFHFEPRGKGLLISPRLFQQQTRGTPREIAWAIEVSSRFVPQATCLVKALAGQAMLAVSGRPSRLLIGVAPGRRAGQTLDAHAWLEWDGEILIGGPDLQRYRMLLACDRAPSGPAPSSPPA
jgi:hypothetical protein